MTLYPSDDTRRMLLEDALYTQLEAELILERLPKDRNAVRHCRELVAALHGRTAS